VYGNTDKGIPTRPDMTTIISANSVLIWGSSKNDTEEKLYQQNLIIKKTD
jgi:hypothetical protein